MSAVSEKQLGGLGCAVSHQRVQGEPEFTDVTECTDSISLRGLTSTFYGHIETTIWRKREAELNSSTVMEESEGRLVSTTKFAKDQGMFLFLLGLLC